MLRRKQKVCVIIPAFNEAQVIFDVIRLAKNCFRGLPYSVDIVLIDDGSCDATSQEAKRAGAIVIRHILNSGAGSATATGLSYAQQYGYTIAATMDADGQHHPEDLVRGIELIQQTQCDLLIGSRLIDSVGMSPIKRLGNFGLSIITYLLFGVKTTDSQSGLRIFSRRALESLKWRTSGYEFCSEMIWRAQQLGLVIDEYPIQAIYTDYSKSKGQNNWNGVNILKSLVRRRLVEIFE